MFSHSSLWTAEVDYGNHVKQSYREINSLCVHGYTCVCVCVLQICRAFLKTGYKLGGSVNAALKKINSRHQSIQLPLLRAPTEITHTLAHLAIATAGGRSCGEILGFAFCDVCAPPFVNHHPQQAMRVRAE